MTNIAYVGYELSNSENLLSPYWQQLMPSSTAISTDVAGEAFQVTLSGVAGNQYAGIVTSNPVSMANKIVAVQVQPGAASSGSNNTWAGIQLSSVVPLPALSNGDPTNNAYTTVRLAIQQGDLWFGYNIGAGVVNSGSTTYDPVNHKVLRILDTGSQLLAHASPDGVTWTSYFSIGGGAYSTISSFLPSIFTELLTYSAGSIVTTAGFSDYTYGFPPPSWVNTTAAGIGFPLNLKASAPPSLAVSASVVIVSNTGVLVSATGNGLPDRIVLPFTYGNTPELIQENLANAVQAAMGDYSMQVVFV